MALQMKFDTSSVSFRANAILVGTVSLLLLGSCAIQISTVIITGKATSNSPGMPNPVYVISLALRCTVQNFCHISGDCFVVSDRDIRRILPTSISFH